jgi:hypothetical protein
MQVSGRLRVSAALPTGIQHRLYRWVGVPQSRSGQSEEDNRKYSAVSDNREVRSLDTMLTEPYRFNNIVCYYILM